MTLPTAEIQTLTPGAEFVGYVLDAMAIGGALYRFHAGVNINGADVVWQGNTYTRYPIQASGFEMTSKGVMPRPTLQVANIDGTIAAQIRAYGDLVGAVVTRKRTLAKFLDAVNFPTLIATDEAFAPSGTTGQLAIGGVPITAEAVVTAMTRTDWQGAQALYATARTNYLTYSRAQNNAAYLLTLATIGAGIDDPAGGTNAFTITATGANGSISRSSLIAVPTGTYTTSVWIRRRTGTGNVQILYPNGSTWTTVAVTGTWTRFSGTGASGSGTTDWGVRCATSGNAVDIAFGQVEPGAVIGSYIPTTSASVTLTDYAATSAGAVTLGETASGTYIWSGSGKGNPTADPTAQFPDDVFYIERKSEENQLSISFELSAACDLQGLLLPRQIVQASCCMWNNAAVCAYSVGGVCTKTLDACKAKYGAADLPFSGFPGTVNA